MKVKEFIELLEIEDANSKLFLEFDTVELELEEGSIESSDKRVTIKFIEKSY